MFGRRDRGYEQQVEQPAPVAPVANRPRQRRCEIWREGIEGPLIVRFTQTTNSGTWVEGERDDGKTISIPRERIDLLVWLPEEDA